MAIDGLAVKSSVATRADLLTAGGAVLLNNTYQGPVSTISVDNVFSSTYYAYRILIRGNTGVTMRLRASGADESGANYATQYIQANSTTVVAARATAATSFDLGGGSLDRIMVIDIVEPHVAAATYMSSTTLEATTAPVYTGRSAYHSLATAYDGFSILGTSLTGRVVVYGFKA